MKVTTDDELSRAVASGLMCGECGASFVKPHGYPVACHYCYRLLSFHDRTLVRKSIHKEANRAANEDYGRQRKKEKLARIARNVEKD